MQQAIYLGLEKAIIALWPKFEPLIMAAAVAALRKWLLAVKAKTVPDDSPFKPFESIGDDVIDQIIALLPAPPAGLAA